MRAWLDEPVRRYADRERPVLRAAGALVGADFVDAGIAVAEIAVSEFPESVDAWVTLALLAQQARRDAQATDAARRALALDPNNRNVRGILGL